MKRLTKAVTTALFAVACLGFLFSSCSYSLPSALDRGVTKRMPGEYGAIFMYPIYRLPGTERWHADVLQAAEKLCKELDHAAEFVTEESTGTVITTQGVLQLPVTNVICHMPPPEGLRKPPAPKSIARKVTA